MDENKIFRDIFLFRFGAEYTQGVYTPSSYLAPNAITIYLITAAKMRSVVWFTRKIDFAQPVPTCGHF